MVEPAQIDTSEKKYEEVKGGGDAAAEPEEDLPQEKKLSGKKVKLMPKDASEPTMLELEIALQSILIKGIIDESGEDDDIPLVEVDQKMLNKIVEFLKYIWENDPPEIEKPIKSNNMLDMTTPYYAEFVNMHHNDVFDLIMAANYMDIKPLLDLSCCKIATLMKGRKITDIRK